MKKSVSRAVHHGLTLIELVIVMAILGILAAMLLPKFEGFQSAANEAAAASSAVDAAKLIGQYKAIKTVYPDMWDSLTDGTSLWTAGNVATKTKGLHSELVGSGSTTDKLTSSTLSAGQVTALQKAGISNLLTVNSSAAATARPGDMFTVASAVSSGSTVAVINSGSTGGKKIIDHVYRQNQLNGGTNTGVINGGDTSTVLVVFGLGPQNALIPNSMMEPPTYGNADAQYIYNRLLVVFEVTATKATFKTVLGADGDLIDDMSQRMQTSTSI